MSVTSLTRGFGLIDRLSSFGTYKSSSFHNVYEGEKKFHLGSYYGQEPSKFLNLLYFVYFSKFL